MQIDSNFRPSSEVVSAPYFQRKTGQVLWTPLLFFGSERVCTETASEQPTGHSGLTSKAEEEGFKVSECHACYGPETAVNLLPTGMTRN